MILSFRKENGMRKGNILCILWGGWGGILPPYLAHAQKFVDAWGNIKAWVYNFVTHGKRTYRVNLLAITQWTYSHFLFSPSKLSLFLWYEIMLTYRYAQWQRKGNPIYALIPNHPLPFARQHTCRTIPLSFFHFLGATMYYSNNHSMFLQCRQ